MFFHVHVPVQAGTSSHLQTCRKGQVVLPKQLSDQRTHSWHSVVPSSSTPTGHVEYVYVSHTCMPLVKY